MNSVKPNNLDQLQALNKTHSDEHSSSTSILKYLLIIYNTFPNQPHINTKSNKPEILEPTNPTLLKKSHSRLSPHPNFDNTL